tara:strand:- start:2979 stop:3197 length:219 start_codon:yes stop_codon:yes gene_type:complete
MNKQINCNDCLSLFITHDPKRRWGCNYFGFKSKFIPSLEVKRITGTECAYFSLKESKKLQKIVINNSNGRLA